MRLFQSRLLLILIAVWAFSLQAVATGDPVVVDPAIMGPAHVEPGRWRIKVQQVFDAGTRTLTRRLYQVWDSEPSRDLDFVWTPDNPAADKPGRINGIGHLAWRTKGKPAYERDSVFAEYRGTARNGRIEGRGAWLDHTGLYYEGEWRAGLMEGHGTLKLPSGDEYTGEFLAGKANGIGRYIDITGEVYEGPFVDGHRHGKGTTTLPNGRQYASLWVNGVETEGSSRVRLAQSGGKGAPGGDDDIRVGITVDKRLPPAPRENERPPGDLFYAVTNSDQGLSIKPDNKRLMGIWKGGAEIQILPIDEDFKNSDLFGVFSLSAAALVPLKLNIEVQNRSTSKIQVKGGYLDVRSSVTDLQPALQLSEESAFEHPDWPGFYRPSFYIENFGWAPAERATLRFRFISATDKSRPNSFEHTRSVEKLERSMKVDLEPLLKSAGVNVGHLRSSSLNGLPCKAKKIAPCIQEARSRGIFGSLSTLVTAPNDTFILDVVGTFDYSWVDHGGVQRQVSAPFRQTVFLGRPHEENEIGEGGQRQVVSAAAQKLRLDATNYRIPFSYTAEVQAGRAGHLILPIEAEKSSQHKYDIVLQLGDGREIRSRPIYLQYFRPRWIRPNFGL